MRERSELPNQTNAVPLKMKQTSQGHEPKKKLSNVTKFFYFSGKCTKTWEQGRKLSGAAAAGSLSEPD
jgi:hypothetical protein